MALRTRLIAPYQHEGVKWLVERELASVRPGGFLCDEMGLGKTVQLIATMLCNPKPHTLVVVPKSIVGQWCAEIKRFAPSLTVHAFDGLKRQLSADARVTVAPYSVLPDRTGKPRCALLGVRWDRVILDEGHEIRNPKSKTCIAARALSAPIRWIVSGTPVFNSMRDFVTLCSFLGIPRDHVQGYTDTVRETYVLRRTKADVARGVYDASGRCIVPGNARLELPPCDFENVELEMYPEERELYQSVFDQGAETVKHIFKSGNAAMHQMELLECLLRVRQVMTWPQLYIDGVALKNDEDPELWTGRSRKMETLLESILSHPKEKTLVFTQFMGEMDEIQARLSKAGVPTYRIDGSVAKELRDARIAEFKRAPPGAVFVIQIKAGGVGLNLQEATRVYITCPSWNPATELQAIGRAHRTGQTQKVVVRRLIYVGDQQLSSVEQSIMQLQDAKAKVCAEVLNDPRIQNQVPNVAKTKVNIQTLRKIFAV
jgi:SNF2 family DNA or RNA helicase